MSHGEETPANLRNHYVICNWNDLGEEIVRQLHAPVVEEKKPIVIVTEHPEEVLPRELRQDTRKDSYEPPQDDLYHGVYIVPGDPTSDQVLARADIKHAETAMVLSDPREKEFADTKSVLIALAVEAIEPQVHTIVELLHSKNRIHFKHTLVDEIVCMDELTEKLLAQAALTHGLSEFYMRLLTATRDTNEVYVVAVPEDFEGHPYSEIERAISDYAHESLILVGVQTGAVALSDGSEITNRHGRCIQKRVLTINPPSQQELAEREDLRELSLMTRDYKLRKGDEVFLLAYKPPNLSWLKPPPDTSG